MLNWLDLGKLMRIVHGSDALRDGAADPEELQWATRPRSPPRQDILRWDAGICAFRRGGPEIDA